MSITNIWVNKHKPTKTELKNKEILVNITKINYFT